jgi:S1-C subfamily serine protease
MQFLTDLLVVILTSYLAFTNFLALQIVEVLGTEDTAVETVEESEAESTSFLSLPSSIASIPDILLRSREYQAATVALSTEPERTTPSASALEAIVNIYCTFTTKETIRTTTGSGFFIDEDGVIMTNAHVAQFLLLDDTDALGEARCIVRNGSPAAPRYMAELLYIPPAWVSEHASLIDAAAPSGTGERDYALLYVTSTVDGSLLPARFPALSLKTDLLSRNAVESTVVAAGYPAKALLSGSGERPLLAHQATTSVSELYTFGSQYADVIALRGSSMGEQGASGGPVVDTDGNVIGIITTRGNDDKDGAGSLRAITISHVDRTITEETGTSLTRHTGGDVKTRADIFTSTIAPLLTELLEAEVANGQD